MMYDKKRGLTTKIVVKSMSRWKFKMKLNIFLQYYKRSNQTKSMAKTLIITENVNLDKLLYKRDC